MLILAKAGTLHVIRSSSSDRVVRLADVWKPNDFLGQVRSSTEPITGSGVAVYFIRFIIQLLSYFTW